MHFRGAIFKYEKGADGILLNVCRAGQPKGNKLTKNDIFNLSIAKVRPLSGDGELPLKELSKQLGRTK